MGQIVLITEGTLNTEINAIDDIVEIHEDDVALTGLGYASYKVLKIEDKTGAEIKAIVNAKQPEQKRAVKVTADKWCFMEEKEVWKNDKDKWCDLIENPKYAFSFQDVTEADRTSLADKAVAVSTKNTILDKVVEKIHLDSKNNIEVVDLNPVVVEL
jgi:hypothetical protein